MITPKYCIAVGLDWRQKRFILNLFSCEKINYTPFPFASLSFNYRNLRKADIRKAYLRTRKQPIWTLIMAWLAPLVNGRDCRQTFFSGILLHFMRMIYINPDLAFEICVVELSVA